MPGVSVDRTYIGIDPGASGGIAAICGDKVWTGSLGGTETDIWQLVWRARDQGSYGGCHAVIEWIHPAIQGVGKSSMSKLYGSYMQLRGYLIAAGIPFEDVKPVIWQRALGIAKRGQTETGSKWKNRLKGVAQRLYPKVKVTLAVCDALLLATYYKRKVEGSL